MHQNEWLTLESQREVAREQRAAFFAALRGLAWSFGLFAALFGLYVLEASI